MARTLISLLSDAGPFMDELSAAPREVRDVHVDVYGLRIGLRTNIPAVREELPAHLPIGWKPPSAGPIDRWYGLHERRKGDADAHHFVLAKDGRPLARFEDLSAAWQLLEFELELDAAEHSPNFVFLHAGVVGWQGGAILIPGQSYSGKSTLVAALRQAGAVYYSDEFALLDPHGQVHAYPRPLRLRHCVPDVVALLPPVVASPTLPALPVALVVLTRHERGAIWQPQPLSTGRAVLAVAEHALSIQRQPQVVLAALGRALQDAATVCGSRGEAKTTAEQILERATRNEVGATA